MADVAARAGVSAQTVSRVINGTGYVSAATRDRVLEAVDVLHYRPNSAAQALVTGRSRSVGVVSADTTLYGPATILRAIERAAHAHGYSVSVASLESLDGEEVRAAVERLQRQGVDGIVLNAGPDDPVRALEDFPTAVPLVTVEDTATSSMPRVFVDQRAGAADATRLLLNCGHRTVWHIAGPENWSSARRRLEGWQRTLQQAGMTTPPLLFGDWSATAGFAHGRELADDPAVTAIFVANDHMAMGVLRALHEAGRRVPFDVSVVGFDDVPEARFQTPSLTTVRQDLGTRGRLTLELLIAAVEGDEGPHHDIVLTPELIVRESSGRALRP